MLTSEENELLTRVGPGTPMGDLLRQYWIPMMLAAELPRPDGPPMRVRLLGEDLVVFRDTLERIGLLAEHCSHRGASLFYGRNEECGLRCIYHGWKYDVEGRCVDMPNEPPESTFKEKIRHRAYPCQERGGMVWTYMGPRWEPPPIPELEWTLMPENQRRLRPFLRECNWVQALEGDLDSSHIGILHRRLDPDGPSAAGTYLPDNHPRLELLQTDYGFVYGARRDEGEDSYYWRITQFLLPFYTLIPGYSDGLNTGHIWVPLDDGNTMIWGMGWNPVKPVEELGDAADESRAVASPGEYLPPTTDGLGRWRLEANAGNDYLLDREVQRAQSFTGIPTISQQDQAATESMGLICNRSQEHLGTTDIAIIQARRRLINAAKALQERGETPPEVDNPQWYRVRSASVALPRNVSWLAATKEWLEARSDVPVSTLDRERIV